MTRILGRVVTPNISTPPSAPITGEMYFDTAASVLYWWNGTAWINASGPGLPAGGTTGQVLGKTAGADYATAWQNVPVQTVWPGSP